MTNRLHLDFSLSTSEERNDFVSTYLTRDEFVHKPPTASELETIANYILWGKDNETGNNFVQDGLGTIETRNKTWSSTEPESLDALMETPGFNEAIFSSVPTKKVREKFDRKQALREAPPDMRPVLEEHFHRIDTIDLGINFYDLIHAQRTKEIRQSLLDKFTQEEMEQIREDAGHWNQFFYLKQKHLLVELRREQFTMRDSFTSTIQRTTPVLVTQDPGPLVFDVDLDVRPLGLVNSLVFKPIDKLNPESFDEEALAQVSQYYWEYHEKTHASHDLFFDFRELEHVYQLLQIWFDFQDDTIAQENVMSNNLQLCRTLEYYIELADLDEMQLEILDMKKAHKSNIDISRTINQTYHKTYSANYISTIFRQKIIPKINNAAALHDEIVGQLFFPEEFKKCSTCGQWKLRTTDFFIRKSRSSDGLSARCKKCDKMIREGKKNEPKKN